MSDIQLSSAAVTAACQAIVDLINNTGGRVLDIRTGPKPGSPVNPDTGVLLARVDLGESAFLPASNGESSGNTPFQTTILSTGTAGHFRIKSSSVSASAIIQGDVGLEDTSIVFDNLEFVEGGAMIINDIKIVVPTHLEQ